MKRQEFEQFDGSQLSSEQLVNKALAEEAVRGIEPELPRTKEFENHPNVIRSGVESSQEGRVFHKGAQELLEQIYDVREVIASYDLYNLNKKDTWVERPDQKEMIELYEVLGEIKKDVLLGTDNTLINNVIDSYTQKHPELLKVYAGVFRELRNKEEGKIKKMFEDAIANLTPNPELRAQLDQATVSLEENLTAEQIKMLKDNFQTGNFLLHCTDVQNTIKILESNNLLTSAEIEEKIGKEWGHGGKDGISFNMNDVRVLTGTKKHFIGFLAAPEAIIDENYKLVVPPSAAEFEVQLVAKTYQNPKVPEDFEKLYNSEGRFRSHQEFLPRVNLKDTFIFCKKNDADMIKELLARLGHKVKGILTYPNMKLRVESWSKPLGDHVVASQLISSAFSYAGIAPTINWRKDLFKTEPQVIEDYAVSDKDVGQSSSIIKTDHGLEVVDN